MSTKFFTSPVKTVSAKADGLVSFIASTAAEDRMGDSISQNGWALDNYKKNPVILFGHDHDKPIGRARSVYMKDGNLAIDVEFAPEDIDPFAAKIGRMVKSGFLNAVSVGFRPLDMKPRKSGGYEFTKSELLEVSVVSVPANQEALMFAKSFCSDREISRLFAAQGSELKVRQARARHMKTLSNYL